MVHTRRTLLKTLGSTVAVGAVGVGQAGAREGARGDDTVVDVDWTSDRRFGLRRLPQQFVADRYRTDALAVQGYRVADRDTSISI